RPVGRAIDPDADPPPRTHVGRPEESHGVREDHGLLLAEWRGQPHGEMVGAMVVIVELGEELASHSPRRLAPRDLLGGFGQRQTDRAQPLERRAPGAVGSRLRCHRERAYAYIGLLSTSLSQPFATR